MRLCIALLGCLLLTDSVQSQPISAADRKMLKVKEDSLRAYARYMVTDSFTHSRMIADSFFTRILVRALRVPNSFYYPFQTVSGISKLYAPDSSFRIFTWNLALQEGPYFARQKGAIQMRTRDGSLKLFPLYDVGDDTAEPEDSARSNRNWIGAVYYNIIATEHEGKKYYTLFGIDDNSFTSNRKWMEVLTFNQKSEPVFGSKPFFSYEKDSIPQQPRYRVSLEFKKNARVLANYIPDLNMILVDHLISESDEPENKWTYVPDGDNEAFQWENGRWVHVDKAFDFKVDMSGADTYLGNPPVGEPILDSKGNKNEKKLGEKSDKNKAKEKPVNQ